MREQPVPGSPNGPALRIFWDGVGYGLFVTVKSRPPDSFLPS